MREFIIPCDADHAEAARSALWAFAKGTAGVQCSAEGVALGLAEEGGGPRYGNHYVLTGRSGRANRLIEIFATTDRHAAQFAMADSPTADRLSPRAGLWMLAADGVPQGVIIGMPEHLTLPPDVAFAPACPGL